MSKQKKCYNTAVKRGQITVETTEESLEDAIQDELDELVFSDINSFFIIDLINNSQNKVFSKDYFETFLKNSIPMELADIVITCYSYAEFLGFDLDKAVELKMKYNESR